MNSQRLVIGQESAPAGGAPGRTADGSNGGGKKAPAGGGMGLMFPILIVFVIFFLMIRPQRKKEKQRKAMLEQVRRGEKVVTIGGIYGEVVSLTDDTIILEVDSESGTTLMMSRSAVSRVVTDEAEDEDAEKVKDGNA